MFAIPSLKSSFFCLLNSTAQRIRLVSVSPPCAHERSIEHYVTITGKGCCGARPASHHGLPDGTHSPPDTLTPAGGSQAHKRASRVGRCTPTVCASSATLTLEDSRSPSCSAVVALLLSSASAHPISTRYSFSSSPASPCDHPNARRIAVHLSMTDRLSFPLPTFSPSPSTPFFHPFLLKDTLRCPVSPSPPPPPPLSL